eukprot:4946695-Pyramimonas_sp.AAC.1
MDPECTDEAIEAFAAQLLPPGTPANRMNIATVLYENFLGIKKKYRAYTRKTTKFRRFTKRYYDRRPGGKGKGKGYQRRQFGDAKRHFPMEYEDDWAFFKGKGKGRDTHPQQHHKNRKDPVAGETMKCHECGSDEHLRRSCPKLHHHVQPSLPAAAASSDQTLAPGTMYMQQHFYHHIEPEAEAPVGYYTPRGDPNCCPRGLLEGAVDWQQCVSDAMGVTDRA